MVNLEILKKFGCTHDRLREIFTETDEESDNFRIRAKFEDMIESRVRQGIFHSAKHSNLFMSVDLAWDSLPINKATIPLLQYAQGKIAIEDAHQCLEDIGVADQFCDFAFNSNGIPIFVLHPVHVVACHANSCRGWAPLPGTRQSEASSWTTPCTSWRTAR